MKQRLIKKSKIMSRTKILILVLLTVFIGFGTSCSNESGEYPAIKRGDFVQTITETGELAAVNVKGFSMPRFGRYWYEMKITGLIDHGTKVQAGDSLIQFDPAEVQKFIIERENEQETQQASLEKVIVEIANKKSDLNSNLMSEQASFNLKKLELEQFRFESDKTKRIKELEFKQAEIRLNKVKRSIELYEIISKNDLTIQQLRVQRTQEQIKTAYEVLPELTIRTPIPGIFQVANSRRSRNELLKIGDEVYYGSRLGNVPDLTWMKVKTVINEADILKVKVGQKVNVRLDALHDVVFQGEVSYISKLCRPIEWESRQKVFDVEVKILVSDERLKPGMTVSCEYFCSQLENVLYAPLDCVEKVGTDHFIYLKKGNGFEKHKVDVGPSNNSNIVLKGDFKNGQKIVKVDQVLNPKTVE